MRQNVEEVYGWIVDDVVTRVRDVFAEEGIDVYVRTRGFPNTPGGGGAALCFSLSLFSFTAHLPRRVSFASRAFPDGFGHSEPVW